MTSGSDEPKILFWGLGSIGRRLARLVIDNFNCQTAAFRHAHGPKNDLGIPEYHCQKEISDFKPDIAFITNPTAHHVATALGCARQGMHLFIEKPLSHSTKGVADLLSAVDQAGLKTYIGCNLRFDPMLQYLKAHLDPERVFYARAMCSSFLPHWRPDQDYRESYSAKKDMGGGVILDLVHEPDYCVWLFGPVHHITGHFGRQSRLEIETEDVADLTLHHENGMVTAIHLDYFGLDPQRCLKIYGQEYYLEADLIGRRILEIDSGHHKQIGFETLGRDHTYLAELKYFFKYLTGQAPPLNDVHEHWQLLEPLLRFRNTGMTDA